MMIKWMYGVSLRDKESTEEQTKSLDIESVSDVIIIIIT